jgi:hypothetical protein
MSKLAARDFHDSRLTSLLHVPSLTELEAAWRSEGGETLSSSRPPPPPAMPEVSSQPPTVAGPTTGQTPTETEGPTQAATAPLSPDAPARSHRRPPAVARDADEPLDLSIAVDPPEMATPSPSSTVRTDALAAPSTSRWLVPLLIIGGAGLLGGAIALGMRGSAEEPDREPQFILVTPAGVRDPPAGSGSGTGGGDTTPIADPATTTMEETPPDPGMLEPPPTGDGTETPRQRAARLSRTFARNQGRVTACIRQHAADAPEGGLTIRFTVDTAGRVEQAVVGPPGVRGTALGECVGEVARSTAFGPQPERSTFSIPITVQRR